MAVHSRPAVSPLEKMPRWPGSDDVRTAMRAWGRQQAAVWNETQRLFTEMDLTMAQFRALSVLRGSDRLTGKDLAARLHITPATLIPLVDRLEAQGYVRRVPDLDDRRLTWIELTKKSYRLFLRLWIGGQARMLQAIRRLSPEDRRELARLLNQVADQLAS